MINEEQYLDPKERLVSIEAKLNQTERKAAKMVDHTIFLILADRFTKRFTAFCRQYRGDINEKTVDDYRLEFLSDMKADFEEKVLAEAVKELKEKLK